VLNFFICQSGFGHHKRVATVIKEIIKIKPNLNIRLFTGIQKLNTIKSRIEFSHLFDNPHITWNVDLYRNAPNYDNQINMHKVNTWITEVKQSRDNISGTIVLDNEALLLSVFPEAVVMGSFIWSDVLAEFGNEDAVAVADYERNLINNTNPDMLGLTDMAMDGVKTKPGFHGLPWFCNQDGYSQNENKTNHVLVTGGGKIETSINLLKMADEIFNKIGARIFLDSQLYEISSKKYPLFDYSTNAFRFLSAVVCRPGIGILTDCVKFRIPVIACTEKGHTEINHNALKVDNLGIGLMLEFQVDLEQKLSGFFNTQNLNLYRKAYQQLKCGGHIMAAQWLIKKMTNE
jgi:hypothetical protein